MYDTTNVIITKNLRRQCEWKLIYSRSLFPITFRSNSFTVRILTWKIRTDLLNFDGLFNDIRQYY